MQFEEATFEYVNKSLNKYVDEVATLGTKMASTEDILDISIFRKKEQYICINDREHANSKYIGHMK